MKEQWQQLSGKFNAMTLRERVTVLVGLIIATVSLFQFFVLDQQQLQKRRLTLQINDVRTSIKAAENALKTQTTVQADPEAVKLAYLEALRKQVAEIDKNMQGLQKGLVPPDEMPKLLEGMLARNRGLQLVSLHKLPSRRLDSASSATPSKPEASKALASKPGNPASPERNIYQHSFELTVQGSYSDLYDYLARLEKLPWRMFWGKISLNAEQSPRLTMTITVHTLSLNKAWLIV